MRRGNYRTELFSELDHSLQGTDSLNFSVGVILTNDEEVLHSDISVKVVDDVPEVTSYQYEEVTAGATAVTGNLLETDGFGADGGYINSITIDGVTFTIESDDTGGFSVSTAGTSEIFDMNAAANLSGDSLSITTLLGETFNINLTDGAYDYEYTGELSIDTPANTAPSVDIADSGGLLGIVGVNALDLLDLSIDQNFTVSDVDNNLILVQLSTSGLDTAVDELVSGLSLGIIPGLAGTLVSTLLGNTAWSYNQQLADELGLSVERGDVDGEKTLTITSNDATEKEISNQAVNELLATAVLEAETDGLLDILGLVGLSLSDLGLNDLLNKVLQTTTISATDSGNDPATNVDDLTTTYSVTELVKDVDILATGGYTANIVSGTNNADTLTPIEDLEDESTRFYGYEGDDNIIASSEADILRGGADDDIMDGGAGSDLMIGGTGNDTMTGGDGVDIFRWEEGDQGTTTEPSDDVITDFNINTLTDADNPGDIIDLSRLLQGEGYVTSELNNLSSYLAFELVGEDTVLSISTAGAFTGEGTDAGLIDQTITFEGVDLFEAGESNADLITRLLEEGKLLVDKATSSTVLGDISREIEVNAIDGDGDTAQGDLVFAADAPTIVETSNSAPTVAGSSQQLLGLVGLDALGILDLSQNDLYVADVDGNLASVTISFSPLVNVDLSSLVSAPKLSVNTALAEEFGLSIDPTSSAGLLGLVAAEASITITATDGGTIDNLQINELLSTLSFNQSDLLSLNLIDYLSISATDSEGSTTTQSLGSLLDANLLDSAEDSTVFIDDEAANIIDVSTASVDVNLYGLDGDDALSGGSGNDLLRGGEGNDTLTGGAGNDLLFGEAGDNTFDGGLGDDTIVTSTLDFSIDGGLGEDTVQFDGTGESIDLSALLATDTGTSEMLDIEVLDINESSETGSTLILDTDAVLNLTDDNDTLRIEGDSNDSVQVDGAEMTGQEVINGATYDTYALGSATLYIDQDVTVTNNNA